MVSKQKILIVDDDNNIAELISLYLTKECYDTRIVNDGEEALIAFEQYNPNLILLDLMLPGIDGYQVCREIRAKSNTPIIMLSAKGEVFDKVLGLEGSTPPLPAGQDRNPTGCRDQMCGISGSHCQSVQLFRCLQRTTDRHASEGAGASLLPCILTESGFYA